MSDLCNCFKADCEARDRSVAHIASPKRVELECMREEQERDDWIKVLESADD